jgi:hypothetical protein
VFFSSSPFILVSHFWRNNTLYNLGETGKHLFNYSSGHLQQSVYTFIEFKIDSEIRDGIRNLLEINTSIFIIHRMVWDRRVVDLCLAWDI